MGDLLQKNDNCNIIEPINSIDDFAEKYNIDILDIYYDYQIEILTCINSLIEGKEVYLLDACDIEQPQPNASEKDGILAYFIGLYYENNNTELALKYHLHAIKNKWLLSYNQVANIYYESKQYDLFVKYNNLAVEFGDSDAMFNFATYYEEVEQNYDMALKYYFMALDNGVTESYYYIGTIYLLKKQYDLSIKYFLLAIEENNDSDAMHSLADYYDNIQKDYTMAKKYYTMAIAEENEDAIIDAGNFYFKHQEYELCVPYYLLAIEKYNAFYSINNLGYYYSIIEKNDSLALKYFHMAIAHCEFTQPCDENINTVQTVYNNIGWHYYNKLIDAKQNSQADVKNDVSMHEWHSELLKYYQMAIDMNFNLSYLNLGRYYEDIVNDYDNAKKYYLLGIEYGTYDLQNSNNSAANANELILSCTFYIANLNYRHENYEEALIYYTKLLVNIEDVTLANSKLYNDYCRLAHNTIKKILLKNSNSNIGNLLNIMVKYSNGNLTIFKFLDTPKTTEIWSNLNKL